MNTTDPGTSRTDAGRAKYRMLYPDHSTFTRILESLSQYPGLTVGGRTCARCGSALRAWEKHGCPK